MRMTTRQIKKIWTVAHHRKIDPDLLRLTVQSVTGERSIRSLSRRRASQLIEKITAERGVEDLSQEASFFDKSTPAQLQMIRRIGARSGWNEKQIAGLARRMYGISRIEDLSVKQASGVIEALKAIMMRKAG